MRSVRTSSMLKRTLPVSLKALLQSWLNEQDTVFKMCVVCALQTRPRQIWIRWNFPSCATVCAGTCRISPSPSSPLHCTLRWSTRPKVRAADPERRRAAHFLFTTVVRPGADVTQLEMNTEYSEHQTARPQSRRLYLTVICFF